MASPALWPDYMKRETLAKRLNLAAGAIDQLVTRGLLPPPITVGDALLWRWADVDSWLQRGQHREPESNDPYLAGVSRARPAASPRLESPQPNRS